MRARALIVIAALLAALPAIALPPGTEDEIRARLMPAGEVCMQGDECGSATAAASGGGTMDGEGVYNQFCFACHAAGVSGAPKLGESADWEPRLAKGMDALWDSTLNGVAPAMPAKGTCMSCSDDELRAALDYMVETVQ